MEPALKSAPPAPMKFYMPFYYSSLETCWTFFSTSADAVKPLLAGKGLKPALFDGKAVVTLFFQQYMGHNQPLPVMELEFCAVAYPKALEAQLPQPLPTFKQLLAGEDQTKVIGFHRLHVAASSAIAVEAGKQLFGENKFLAGMDLTWPGLDAPPDQKHGWTFHVADALSDGAQILSLSIKKPRAEGFAGNPVPVSFYDMKEGKLSCSRWNIFGAFDTNLIDPHHASSIELDLGCSKHPMAEAMRAVGLGRGAKPIALQVYQSPPCAVQSQAFNV